MSDELKIAIISGCIGIVGSLLGVIIQAFISNIQNSYEKKAMYNSLCYLIKSIKDLIIEIDSEDKFAQSIALGLVFPSTIFNELTTTIDIVRKYDGKATIILRYIEQAIHNINSSIEDVLKKRKEGHEISLTTIKVAFADVKYCNIYLSDVSKHVFAKANWASKQELLSIPEYEFLLGGTLRINLRKLAKKVKGLLKRSNN